MGAVATHRDLVSVIATGRARIPFAPLSFLRYKILYIHLTNVYDNLPADELVRRDGQLYLVETRGYLPATRPHAIAGSHGVRSRRPPAASIDQLILESARSARLSRARCRLLAGCPGTRCVWKSAWSGSRASPRSRCRRALTDHLDDLLADRARRRPLPSFARRRGELRQPRSPPPPARLSPGTGHLRGDHGRIPSRIPGPGKLDGSVVNWVNGALLRAIGARTGYDVHFAPFCYRAGSRTSILYTTLRE